MSMSWLRECLLVAVLVGLARGDTMVYVGLGRWEKVVSVRPAVQITENPPVFAHETVLRGSVYFAPPHHIREHDVSPVFDEASFEALVVPLDFQPRRLDFSAGQARDQAMFNTYSWFACKMAHDAIVSIEVPEALPPPPLPTDHEDILVRDHDAEDSFGQGAEFDEAALMADSFGFTLPDALAQQLKQLTYDVEHVGDKMGDLHPLDAGGHGEATLARKMSRTGSRSELRLRRAGSGGTVTNTDEDVVTTVPGSGTTRHSDTGGEGSAVEVKVLGGGFFDDWLSDEDSNSDDEWNRENFSDSMFLMIDSLLNKLGEWRGRIAKAHGHRERFGVRRDNDHGMMTTGVCNEKYGYELIDFVDTLVSHGFTLQKVMTLPQRTEVPVYTCASEESALLISVDTTMKNYDIPIISLSMTFPTDSPNYMVNSVTTLLHPSLFNKDGAEYVPRLIAAGDAMPAMINPLTFTHCSHDMVPYMMWSADNELRKLLTLTKSSSRREVMSAIGRVHWHVAIAMPFYRGAAAIMEWFATALAASLGQRIGRRRVLLDIKAFHLSLSQFAMQYDSFHEL